VASDPHAPPDTLVEFCADAFGVGSPERRQEIAAAVLRVAHAHGMRYPGEHEAPRPGEMHPIDKSFYELAVKERNYERVKVDRLETEVRALREERDQRLRERDTIHVADQAENRSFSVFSTSTATWRREATMAPPKTCPRADEHTKCPGGYLAWHEWAEQMTKTHRQIRCPGCGLYEVWIPKGDDDAAG
jgi:hypothetical protein